MTLDFNHLQSQFTDFLSGHRQYQETLSLVQRNSEGKIWLIGGFLYRNLARQLYGVAPPAEVDFDFLVQKLHSPVDLPNPWEQRTNRNGNPKWVNRKVSSFSIDIIPLENVKYTVVNKLTPTLDNYLMGVPLTIQSIAYDVEEQRIIGEVGIRALEEKSIRVHHPEFAAFAAQRKEKTLHDYIWDKAIQLGFKAMAP